MWATYIHATLTITFDIFIAKIQEGGLYVDDQAPVHGTRGWLVGVKKALGIPLHERPSCSPDLNPIENVEGPEAAH